MDRVHEGVHGPEVHILYTSDTKSVDFLRTIVDVVWPRSLFEPQKAREK